MSGLLYTAPFGGLVNVFVCYERPSGTQNGNPVITLAPITQVRQVTTFPVLLSKRLPVSDGCSGKDVVERLIFSTSKPSNDTHSSDFFGLEDNQSTESWAECPFCYPVFETDM